MDYVTLPPKVKIDILRRHLMQAEADHFVHTLQADEARADKASADAGPQLDALAEAAAAKVEIVKARLDELGASYTAAPPEEVPADTPPDAVPADTATALPPSALPPAIAN